MSREIRLGAEIIDQFAVFESDGYTKVSGEVSFTTTLWDDGVVNSSVSVVVAEIGTSGEYTVTFTPDSAGFWVLEVLIDSTNDIYESEYVVSASGGNAVIGTPFDPAGVLT